MGTSEAARDIRDATLVKEGDLFMLADLRANAERLKLALKRLP